MSQNVSFLVCFFYLKEQKQQIYHRLFFYFTKISVFKDVLVKICCFRIIALKMR